VYYGIKLSAMINTCISVKEPNGVKDASVLNEEIVKWIRMKVERTENENQLIKKLKKTIQGL
jgi:hypothetical protein